MIEVAAPADARRLLGAYLDELEAEPLHAGSVLARLAGRAVPPSRRFRARLSVTRLLAPQQRFRARTLALRGDVRLHLGSGKSRKEGWVNIDLALHPVDLAWVLTRKLPFTAGTVDAIFYEFCLEHLTPREVLGLHCECFRVLQPAGVLRGACWDARTFLAAFVEAPGSALGRPACPTPMLALSESLYTGLERRSVWEAESLMLVFAAAGFEQPVERAFGDSGLVPCPDTPARSDQALYVEAAK